MATPTTFFDLQVNGYAGVDFNSDDLTPERAHEACAKLEADGVGGILATIITENLETMARRLRRIAELRERDALVRRIIAGIHIEGPFLNEKDGFRGAHPLDAVRPASADDMRCLLDAAQGLTRIVTLAPERDPGLQVTRMLAERGITVSAGHCDPSLDELRAALDAGLTMFTHLGNGCPMLLDRHDNIIQRALSLSDRLTISFIADGVHVPWFALANYLRVAGLGRSVIVSDAIAPAGLGPGRYRFARWDLQIGEDRVARAPDGSHLIGSACPMRLAAQNLRQHLGLTESEVRQLTVLNPRAVIQR
jgi:N-acetylglucosamine-6-phosphate deacetylase